MIQGSAKIYYPIGGLFFSSIYNSFGFTVYKWWINESSEQIYIDGVYIKGKGSGMKWKFQFSVWNLRAVPVNQTIKKLLVKTPRWYMVEDCELKVVEVFTQVEKARERQIVKKKDIK